MFISNIYKHFNRIDKCIISISVVEINRAFIRSQETLDKDFV